MVSARFHFAIILLKFDCDISKREKTSQTDLVHPVTAQYPNSVGSLEQTILKQLLVFDVPVDFNTH